MTETENTPPSPHSSNVLCAGRVWVRKFADGDRVRADGYADVMIVDGIDEFLTRGTNKLHYILSSEDYVLGKRKVNTGEPCSEEDLSPCA